MLKLPTYIVQPGMMLAQPIVDNRGRTLLRNGVVLTDEYIEVLKQRGFASVAVESPGAGQIIVPDDFPAEVHHRSKRALADVFGFVRQIAGEFAADGGTPKDVTQDPELSKTLQRSPAFDELETVVSTMLNEVLEKNTKVGLAQLQQSGDHRLNHAINVAVVGLLIGKCLHLSVDDLKRLGIACMLHDIGKIFFSGALFKSNGKLTTPASLEQTRNHTRLGYELLRSRNPDNVLVNHVALEHHERQDGKGYPRGLRSTNQVQRTRFDRETILLISEITTVADVFDVLSRATPHRPALSPQQIHATMRQLSGTFLNREIVNIFLRLLPALPIGLPVVVRSGRYSKYSGMVISANSDSPHRPNIRLQFNPYGARITPIDINLAAKPDIFVEATL